MYEAAWRRGGRGGGCEVVGATGRGDEGVVGCGGGCRGVSFRPQIFMVALQMIGEHPWTGLGLGGNYYVYWNEFRFDHSHNLFTHVAIELGLPGLLLWCAVWFGALWQAWKVRDTQYGKGIIGMWVFSTLGLLRPGQQTPRPGTPGRRRRRAARPWLSP